MGAPWQVAGDMLREMEFSDVVKAVEYYMKHITESYAKEPTDVGLNRNIRRMTLMSVLQFAGFSPPQAAHIINHGYKRAERPRHGWHDIGGEG